MRVLDLCAAPGSKSFGAALCMQNKGELLSFDLHKNKVSLIKRGAERLGLSIITADAGDARHAPDKGLGLFDRVIADVPCSGFGVIAKKPDIRRKKEEDIERLPEIQAQILRESAKHLKCGGTLVYSTCTLNPKENKEIVEAFLAENKDFELVPFKVGALEASEGMKELFPHIHKTDGFFIAKLTKK
jgi:16S rRNA (cytosine967-C5)-methyltransferase